MRLQVRSLALRSGLRIRRCREMWCGSQTRLGSRVAVALAEAGGYSSDSIPSLGTSICRRSGPRKKAKTPTHKKKSLGGPAFHWRGHLKWAVAGGVCGTKPLTRGVGANSRWPVSEWSQTAGQRSASTENRLVWKPPDRCTERHRDTAMQECRR